jgi:hypothetical protein
MVRKGLKPEQIIRKPREAEVLLSQDDPSSIACSLAEAHQTLDLGSWVGGGHGGRERGNAHGPLWALSRRLAVAPFSSSISRVSVGSLRLPLGGIRR